MVQRDSNSNKHSKQLMNWKEIKKKYPKAYSFALQEYYKTFDILIDDCNIEKEFNIRYLYDFFDEQGLRIFLKQGTMDTYLDFDIENRIKDFKKESILSWDEQKAGRKEIEEIAFTKAFEILEKQ